ncbi:hypothetical protein GCM10010340_08060 [Streptomyces griseoloalbus]|nr:hypothetical protein GCM10010294_61660 [Streptomyces griseoloalbus]GGW32764.1 hypothetical protein GCM10010340_08060 [Streptomyces albaduncus]
MEAVPRPCHGRTEALDPPGRLTVAPLTECVPCATVAMRVRLRISGHPMPDHPITLAFERLVPLYAHSPE